MSQAKATKKASHAMRMVVFQRRAARCSRIEAMATFSSMARSQLLWMMLGGVSGDSGMGEGGV